VTATLRNPTSRTFDEQFALDRFGRLLHRRLQVAVACKQMPSAADTQSWLIRALDGAIADDLCLLKRLGQEADASDLLVSFRQTMDWLSTSRDRAA
jgi:hypothetical protein